MTLKETYSKRQQSVLDSLNDLKSKIKHHGNDFEKNSNYWSYVGDLCHIEKSLKEIMKFLGTI